jgi:hypothetical protein
MKTTPQVKLLIPVICSAFLLSGCWLDDDDENKRLLNQTRHQQSMQDLLSILHALTHHAARINYNSDIAWVEETENNRQHIDSRKIRCNLKNKSEKLPFVIFIL